jgi:hypothetical protein
VVDVWQNQARIYLAARTRSAEEAGKEAVEQEPEDVDELIIGFPLVLGDLKGGTLMTAIYLATHLMISTGRLSEYEHIMEAIALHYEICLKFHSHDQFSANVSVNANLEDIEPPNIIGVSTHCTAHQAQRVTTKQMHHVSGSENTTKGGRMADSLYSITKLSEQGRYFGDLRGAVAEVIYAPGGFEWVNSTGVPAERLAEHRSIVRQCLPNWAKLGKAAREAMEQFLRMLTGLWAMAFCVMHVCIIRDGVPCCNSKEDAMRKTIEAIQDFLWWFMPGVPTETRWLSFVENVSFWGLGTMVHNLVPRIWRLAFPKVTAKYRKRLDALMRRGGGRGRGGRGRGFRKGRGKGGGAKGRGRGRGRARGGPAAAAGRGRGRGGVGGEADEGEMPGLAEEVEDSEPEPEQQAPPRGGTDATTAPSGELWLRDSIARLEKGVGFFMIDGLPFHFARTITVLDPVREYLCVMLKISKEQRVAEMEDDPFLAFGSALHESLRAYYKLLHEAPASTDSFGMMRSSLGLDVEGTEVAAGVDGRGWVQSDLVLIRDDACRCVGGMFHRLDVHLAQRGAQRFMMGCGMGVDGVREVMGPVFGRPDCCKELAVKKLEQWGANSADQMPQPGDDDDDEELGEEEEDQKSEEEEQEEEGEEELEDPHEGSGNPSPEGSGRRRGRKRRRRPGREQREQRRELQRQAEPESHLGKVTRGLLHRARLGGPFDRVRKLWSPTTLQGERLHAGQRRRKGGVSAVMRFWPGVSRPLLQFTFSSRFLTHI